MSFLNYPIEIWIALIVAVLVRLKASVTLSWTGALSTVLVALGSGLTLYKPMISLSGIDPTWELIVAILVALTAENLMKWIVDFSEDEDIVKGIFKSIIKRDPSHIIKGKDDK